MAGKPASVTARAVTSCVDRHQSGHRTSRVIEGMLVDNCALLKRTDPFLIPRIILKHKIDLPENE